MKDNWKERKFDNLLKKLVQKEKRIRELAHFVAMCLVIFGKYSDEFDNILDEGDKEKISNIVNIFSEKSD